MALSRHPRWPRVLVLVLLATCSDATPPFEPAREPAPAPPASVIQCIAEMSSGTVTCESPRPAGGLAQASLILGGQNTYMRVSSSSPVYDAGTEAFTFDVTLENLIGQALGTADGTTVSGVRVFFHDSPTAIDGSGTIIVHADGTDSFTGTDQPFYLYDEIIAPAGTSAGKGWHFTVPATVTTFGFSVFVAAEVRFPDGWIDLAATSGNAALTLGDDADNTVQLAATVRDRLGRVLPETPAWSSSDETVATVSADGLVTAQGLGSAMIAASSGEGARTGSVAVSVSGPATHLVMVQEPTDVSAGSAITPAIQVAIRDDFGNTVPDATHEVTLALEANEAGGTLAGTTTRAAVNGVATFGDLTLGRSGTGYTLVAAAAGLTGVASASFDVATGALATFLVEAAAGGAISTQAAGAPFNVRVVAHDAHGNTVTGFTGTATMATEPVGALTAGSTTSAFTAGVLSSHSVTLSAGAFQVRATRAGGAETGLSNAFDVQAAPVAVNDSRGAGSVPGNAYHAYYSTASAPVTFELPAPGILANDNRAHPLALITSIGADSLGGSAATYGAGTTVSPLPGTGRTTGSLSVGSNGNVVFTPPDDFTGDYVFRYRLRNTLGTSDGRVTIAVGVRPSAQNDTYPDTLVGNATLNTATRSPQFRVTDNDAGNRLILSLTGQQNGVTTLNSDGTFIFTPTPGYTGPASFTYIIRNGFGQSGPATVSMVVGPPAGS